MHESPWQCTPWRYQLHVSTYACTTSTAFTLTLCEHQVRMHHVNSIHTYSMLASGTHASHQQHSLLLICFCCQQVKTNKQDVSPGGDGNPVHFDINFEAGTPTRGAYAPRSPPHLQLGLLTGVIQRSWSCVSRLVRIAGFLMYECLVWHVCEGASAGRRPSVYHVWHATGGGGAGRPRLAIPYLLFLARLHPEFPWSS